MGDVARLAVIDTELARLDLERDEIETALADIRGQLDAHHEDRQWRGRAKAALRYRGIDHQGVLREIAELKRERKAIDQRIADRDQPFPNRFVAIAKVMLPPETYATIRDLAMAGRSA